MRYVPELGQASFGQPWQSYDVPEFVQALLSSLRDELDRIMWNAEPNAPMRYPNPFNNTGGSFRNATFEVEAYSWSDEEQPYNFKWRDIKISWYKYLGRGMSTNTEFTPDLAIEMYNDCWQSLQRLEKEHAGH